ncbi:MAG: M28 family metallopeptidase [Anaeromyxobacter sp.]
MHRTWHTTVVGLAAGALLAATLTALALPRVAPPAERARCDAFHTLACFDAARMKADVAELASPRLAGRAAGTPENEAAVTMLEQRLRAVLAPVPGLPGYRFTSEDGRWREGQFQVVSYDNLVGVLPGSDPALRDQVLILSAHLDGQGRTADGRLLPSADDDASGTAVVLELMRAVAASPTRPRRTLLFALWNGEERGMAGSCDFVLSGRQLPLDAITAVFNLDMVGGDAPGMDLWGGYDHPWFMRLAGREAAENGLRWPITSLPGEDRSDQACFRTQGVPAFMITSPGNPDGRAHYHQPSDTAERVPRESLEAAAMLVWATVRPLAMGEETPPRREAPVRGAPRE